MSQLPEDSVTNTPADSSDANDTITLTVPNVPAPSSSTLSEAATSEHENQLPVKPIGTEEHESTAPAIEQDPSQPQVHSDADQPRASSSITPSTIAKDTPEWEAARAKVVQEMATSEQFPIVAARTTSTPRGTSERGSRGSGRGRRVSGTNGESTPVANKIAAQTPSSSGRGRGKVGRPRGSGRARGAGATSRGSKRKREAGGSDDGDSTSSEEFVAVSVTKSGRAVQKPTAFVPPPMPTASPTTSSAIAGHKRKRVYRRNPESAVCKVCLRGTSPANNMIVFCDGCNSAYHRFCHQPPIDQSVVDEVDKEWYCKQCEKARVEPVAEVEVADFVSAKQASVEQRQRYFASLPQGMLITLLTRATTLHPDLPVFPPDFVPRPSANDETPPRPAHIQASPSSRQKSTNTTPKKKPTTSVALPTQPIGYDRVPDDHPPNYPQPGNGLMKDLPSQGDDAKWLVDDGDQFGVFTHIYRVDPQAANAGSNGASGG